MYNYKYLYARIHSIEVYVVSVVLAGAARKQPKKAAKMESATASAHTIFIRLECIKRHLTELQYCQAKYD